MSKFAWGLIVGLLLGGFLGIAMMAILVAGRDRRGE